MLQYLEWGISMHRKKRSFFHSILFRSSLWIVLPGIAGMFLVAYFVGIQMRYQIEKQITEEMQRVRDNSLLYVQQTLLLNDSRMDAVSFQLYKNEIEEQLRNAGYDGIFLCSPEGALLAGDAGAFALRKEQEDFARAGEQESAFVICYGKGGQCEVYFSMPVNLNGQFYILDGNSYNRADGKDTFTLIDGKALVSQSELSQLGVLKLQECVILENSYLRLRYGVIR